MTLAVAEALTPNKPKPIYFCTKKKNKIVDCRRWPVMGLRLVQTERMRRVAPEASGAYPVLTRLTTVANSGS